MSIVSKKTPQKPQPARKSTFIIFFCSLIFIITIFFGFLWFSHLYILREIKELKETVNVQRKAISSTLELQILPTSVQQLVRQFVPENKLLDAIQKMTAENQKLRQKLQAAEKIFCPPKIMQQNQQQTFGSPLPPQPKVHPSEESEKFFSIWESLKQNLNDFDQNYKVSAQSKFTTEAIARNGGYLKGWLIQKISEGGSKAIQWWGQLF